MKGNATVDNTIADCTQCVTGQFMNVTCTEEQDAQCKVVTLPEANQYIKTAATALSDNEVASCSTCADGKYKTGGCIAYDTSKDTECTDHTALQEGKYIKTAGNGTLDNILADCTQCAAGSFVNKTCSADTDAQCKVLTQPEVDKEYIKAPGDATKDNDIATCTECPSGKHKTGGCADAADTECADHTAPEAGVKFIKTAGNATMDNAIEQCSVCAEGNYSKTQCTEDKDTECVSHTVPEENNGIYTKYILTPGDATKDNQLVDCQVCQDKQVQGSDKKCFVKTNCTTTANTECDDCTECTDTQVQKQACSEYANGVCEEAPSYTTIEVETGKECKMGNGTSIASTEYLSTSKWLFLFLQGSNDAFSTYGSVEAPCNSADCDKKQGTINAQQKVNADKSGLVVPDTVEMKVQGPADGWCIKSLCVSSSTEGAKAFKWSGTDKWMNPASSGPEATGGPKFTVPLTAVDSCDSERFELSALEDIRSRFFL